MKQFSIYISNKKSGNCRDIRVFAKDAVSARFICEDSCLKDNEVIFSVYPSDKTPKVRKYENQF